MSQAQSTAQIEGQAPKRVPVVHVEDIQDATLKSMMRALTYEEADAEIRKGADSFSFESGNGNVGRIDVVSIGTKVPCEDFWDVRVVKDADGSETLYAGIYDGHNGPETAELLKRDLIPYIVKELAKPPGAHEDSSLDQVIQKAFVEIDDKILDLAKTALHAGHPAGAAELRATMGPAYAGSCALLLIYEPKTGKVRIATTGDSEAVRGQLSSTQDGYTTDSLTEKHNACNADEYARIAAAHPGEEDTIMNKESGRTLGHAVSRAFGNYTLKWPADLVQLGKLSFHGPRPHKDSKTPPYMIAQPDVTMRSVSTQDFVILASDGIWEALKKEDAVECVSRWLAARKAGRPETFEESRESRYEIDGGNLCRIARPEDFAIEDLDNAAVCLLKNVLGGRHKYMVAGAMTAKPPLSRMVHDDMTVQVIFFEAP